MGLKRIDRIVRNNAFICFFVRNLLRTYYARISGVSAEEFNQIETTTAYDRYPELFRAVRDLMSPRDREKIRILSYGCSTGQECWTLRKYFPDAHIVGLEINKRSLRAAQARNTDAEIEFFQSTPQNLREHGPYDVIFALSVLCRWPETQFVTNTSRLYPFAKFEETVALLDASLAFDGLLTICNANYHFSDTRVADRYYGVAGVTLSLRECVHKFSKNHEKHSDHSARGWIYRKIPDVMSA